MHHTQDNACRELLLAVVAQALAEDDSAWIMSDTASAYCAMVGVSEPALFRLRLRYLLNLLDVRRFDARRLHGTRYAQVGKGERTQGENASAWQSWPENAPLRRG